MGKSIFSFDKKQLIIQENDWKSVITIQDFLDKNKDHWEALTLKLEEEEWYPTERKEATLNDIDFASWFLSRLSDIDENLAEKWVNFFEELNAVLEERFNKWFKDKKQELWYFYLTDHSQRITRY